MLACHARSSTFMDGSVEVPTDMPPRGCPALRSARLPGWWRHRCQQDPQSGQQPRPSSRPRLRTSSSLPALPPRRPSRTALRERRGAPAPRRLGGRRAPHDRALASVTVGHAARPPRALTPRRPPRVAKGREAERGLRLCDPGELRAREARGQGAAYRATCCGPRLGHAAHTTRARGPQPRRTRRADPSAARGCATRRW